MQEQAFLLPGSQGGKEVTSVWSHGAHCFLSLPQSHPSTLLFSFSFIFLPFWSGLVSFTFSSQQSPLSPFPSCEGHTESVGGKERATPLGQENTNKQAVFPAVGRIFPRIEGYFHMSPTWFEGGERWFYICKLCLSPVVEGRYGS